MAVDWVALRNSYSAGAITKNNTTSGINWDELRNKARDADQKTTDNWFNTFDYDSAIKRQAELEKQQNELSNQIYLSLQSRNPADYKKANETTTNNKNEISKLKSEYDDVTNQINYYNYLKNQKYIAEFENCTNTGDYTQNSKPTEEKADVFMKGLLDSGLIISGANKEMSDKEIGVYSYYINKGDNKKATNYLEAITSSLNRKAGEKIANSITSIDIPVIEELATFFYGVYSGAESSINGIGQAVGRLFGNTDPYDVTISSYAMQSIGETSDNWFQKMASGVGSAVGGMLPAVAASLAFSPAAGAIAMGISSGGNAYAQARREGKDDTTALIYGGLVGASDALTQYLLGGINKVSSGGLSKLVAKNSFVRGIATKLDDAIKVVSTTPTIQKAFQTAVKFGKFAARANDEGFQEFLQANLEPMIRALTYGEKVDIDLLSSDKLESYLMGFLTAGLFNGADVIAAHKRGTRLSALVQDETVRNVLLDPANTETLINEYGYDTAKLIKEKVVLLNNKAAKANATTQGDTQNVKQMNVNAENAQPPDTTRNATIGNTLNKEADNTASSVIWENYEAGNNIKSLIEAHRNTDTATLARFEESTAKNSDVDKMRDELYNLDSETGAASDDIEDALPQKDVSTADKGIGESKGTTFSQGSLVPDKILKTKPKYSPVADKWLENGGQITIENGNWKYTNSQGTSVTYKNGFPDFTGSGHVKQEVDIGSFKNRAADFKMADKMAPNGPKSPDSTWHHHEDGKTLQEVDKKIHEQFRHEGGIAGMKKNN